MNKLSNNIGTFDLAQDRSGTDMLSLKKWEDEIHQLFVKYIKPNSTVIDIGAHIGYHTVGMAKLCPEGNVIAFEPNPDMAGIILKNVAQNGCNNVVYYPYALGEHNKVSYLLHKESSFMTQITDSNTGIPIPVRRLDDFQKFGKVDLVKLDVEGTELEVLKGAANFIKKYKPIIIIEFWDPGVAEGLRLLSSYGYSLSHICTDNYLALPNQ